MVKISELLRQKYELKCNYRDIARSLNISVGTIVKYIARAKAAGISWPLVDGMTEEILYSKLFLPVEPKVKRTPPDWAQVHLELRRKGVTLMLLWQEYRAVYAVGLSYSRFCQGYSAYSKSISPVSGRSFESFIIKEIIKGIIASGMTNADYQYYRTAKGAEIDLIVTTSSAKIPIEIKMAKSVTLKQLSSLTKYIEDNDLPFGLMIVSPQ